MRRARYQETALGLYRWLASLQVAEAGYDQGGIRDPLSGCVEGEHYSTSHFALMGALLRRLDPAAVPLAPVLQALEFHIRTSADEYPPKDWGYHWDFNNYAFIRACILLEGDLPEDLERRCRKALRSWKESTHKTVNWLFMRAHNALSRRRVAGTWLDGLRAKRHLGYALRCQLADGCIEDLKGISRPIQYHAFSAAMLHKLHQFSGEAHFLERFLTGLNYLLPFIGPDGDFNYLGRGHEQIFGYGVALYVLEAGIPHQPKAASTLAAAAERCLDHLLGFRMPEGAFPLVLNHTGNNTRHGWYDYHHLTVYNAFLGAWLAECALLRGPDHQATPTLPQREVLFSPSGRYLCNREAYFLCLAEGEPGSKYYADCGLTIQHLWAKGFGALLSCPGGPGGHTGKGFAKRYALPKDSARNFSAPLARRNEVWLTPSGGQGRLLPRAGGGCQLEYAYPGGLHVLREVIPGEDTLTLCDRIEVADGATLSELRLINLPLLGDWRVLDGDVLAPADGASPVRIRVATDHPCETGAETLHTAKGMAQNNFWRLRETPRGPAAYRAEITFVFQNRGKGNS